MTSIIYYQQHRAVRFDPNKQRADVEIIMPSHPAFYSKASTKGGVQTAPVFPVGSKQLTPEEEEPYILPLK